MNSILFLCFLPLVFSQLRYDLNVKSDNDCWSQENPKITDKHYAVLVKFSSTVAYGQHPCSIHMTSPWLREHQDGFGVFLVGEMDCSSTVTIDCLPDDNQTMSTSPVQFTCHSSVIKVVLPCRSIALTYKRNLKVQETKKTTSIQVTALAKEPCSDRDIFFRCPTDYPHSCLDKSLQCNGRSECPSGSDERRCHREHSSGLSWIWIILIVLASLFLLCILSTVLIFCCCRAACNGIVRRFQSKKKNQKADVTVIGEDAGLMKGLTGATTVVEVLPQSNTEPAPLIIDSTKPVYPRLD